MQKLKNVINTIMHKNTFKYKNFEFQDPVFLCVVIYIVLLYDYSGFMRLSFLASVLHEMGHVLLYIIICKKVPKIRVTATGFCMRIKGLSFAPFKMLCLAVAGPLANLIIAIMCYISVLNKFTLHVAAFGMANILLCCFNLLPIAPFDGEVILKILAQKLLFLKK